MSLIIRKYFDADKDSVIKLLRLNTPKYFAPDEEADLINYLENHVDNFFLLTKEDAIIGCGGINFADDGKTAEISWDIVHPESQGKGHGTLLLAFRIEEMLKKPNFQKITVRTSQLVFPFYEKHGFKLIQVQKDYWASGFDLYQMERKF